MTTTINGRLPRLDRDGLDRLWQRIQPYIDTNVASVNSTLSQRIAYLEAFFSTDADNIINKWQEIVDFLDGLDGSEDLEQLLSDLKTLIGQKIASSEKGAANGVATLDGRAKVPTSQLPDATTTAKGVVQVGDGLSVGTDGKLKVGVGDGLLSQGGQIVLDIAQNSDIIFDGQQHLDTMGKTTKYCTSDTAAGTAAKEATMRGEGAFALEQGTRVAVKFANGNTADSPTLNVGGTGARSIFHNGAQITTGAKAKALLKGVVEFVYDGSAWHVTGGGVSHGAGEGLYEDASGDLAVRVGDGLDYSQANGIRVKPADASVQVGGNGVQVRLNEGEVAGAPPIRSGLKKVQQNDSESGGIALDLVDNQLPDTDMIVSGEGGDIYPVVLDMTGKVGARVPAKTTKTGHYTPTGGTAMAEQEGATGAWAKDTEHEVLTGVEATVDEKGHLTALKYTTQKIKDTDTTYTADRGAKLNGTEIQVNPGTGIEIENYQSTPSNPSGTERRVALKEASTAERGGMKVKNVMGDGNQLDYLESTGRNYGVQLSSDGKGFVHVPWTDNNTEYSLMTSAEATHGTSLVGRVISPKVLDGAIEERIPDAITDEEIDEIFARHYSPTSGYQIAGDTATLSQIAFYMDVNKASPLGARRVDTGGSESMRAVWEANVVPVLMDASGRYVELDRNDGHYLADGTQVADLSTHALLAAYAHLDYMNIIPQHYGFVQSVTEGSETFLRCWYSPVPIPGGFTVPRQVVGRFKTSLVDGAMRSIPNAVPTGANTIYQFWQAAQQRSADHGLAGHRFRTALLVHMMSKYGYRDSQACEVDGTTVWGVGLDGTESRPSDYPSTGFGVQKTIRTGHALALGMADGNVGVTDANGVACHGVNVLGFENPWGQYWEMCGGLCSVGTTGYQWDVNFIPATSPTASTFDGIDHTTFTRPTQDTTGNDNGAASNTYEVLTLGIGTQVGLSPVVTATVRRDSVGTRAFGDAYWYNANGQLWQFGGNSRNGARCGLACAFSNHVWSASDANLSARLAFYGMPSLVTKEEIVNN